MKNIKKRLERIGKADWCVAALWLLSTHSVRPSTVACGAVITGYFIWKMTRPLNHDKD